MIAVGYFALYAEVDYRTETDLKIPDFPLKLFFPKQTARRRAWSDLMEGGGGEEAGSGTSISARVTLQLHFWNKD